MPSDQRRTPPIVDVDWLGDHLDEVIVCDVRWYLDGRSGVDAYRERHVPGAVFVDLDTVLSSPPAHKLGRHPLPPPEDFARDLGRLGVPEGSTVIAYDDASGMVAGRFVWMLRILGEEAAVLDGGLDAWHGPLEPGDVRLPPVERSLRLWPDHAFVTADEVAATIADGGVVIDSRSADRYSGHAEGIDPRPGHIPGAINLPFADNLDDEGRFMLPAELQRRFSAASVSADTIFYCGSGVSACHNLLAAEAAGLGRPRLYVGSWSGWSSDPERPVSIGPD